MLVLVRQDREASDSETVYRGVSSWQSFPEKLDLLEWHGQGKCRQLCFLQIYQYFKINNNMSIFYNQCTVGGRPHAVK